MSDGGDRLGRTLAIGAIALGLGYAASVALDWHSHTCDRCGYRWRHLGRFAVGSEPAHTCLRCGDVQWWKCGVSAEVRALHAAYVPPRSPSSPRMRHGDTRGAY